MKLLLFFVLGYYTLVAFGNVPEDEQPQDSSDASELGSAIKKTDPTANSKFSLSDGSRIHVKGKHFSIVPPLGWEVHLGFPNISLLMQVPFDPEDGYQRTIQVMKFVDGVPIDDITAKNFQEVIASKFALASPAIEGYRIRNYTITDLSNGHPAILFYSEFNIGDKNMMQAHLLASSSDHRFLITFTDLAIHFEGDLADQYLSEAWESMISIELDSRPPYRLEMPFVIGFGAGAVFLLILLVLVYRKSKAGSEYVELIEAVDTVKQLHESGTELEGISLDGLSHDDSIAAVAKSALLDDSEKEHHSDSDEEWNLEGSHGTEDDKDHVTDMDEIEDKVS